MAQFEFEATAEEVAQALAGEIHGRTGQLSQLTHPVVPYSYITSLDCRCLASWTLRGGRQSNIPRPAKASNPGRRNTSKVQETEKAFKTISPYLPIRCLKLDLSSQKHIRKAAAEVNGYRQPIDRLLNNAAIMAAPYAVTEDSLEAQFGTIYVGL